MLRPQNFSFQIVSEFIDTFVKFLTLCPGVGPLTPCLVPEGGFLYTVIVQGGGFLPPSSRVPGVCPGGLHEIDNCIRIRCPSHDVTHFIHFD